MGTFNEHINPQGYNLGGSPSNENPFFEFEGGGGGGLSPENVNITGTAEYDSEVATPEMTVNKAASEDSVNFNINLKIPDTSNSGSGSIEVVDFQFNQLLTLAELAIRKFYPTAESLGEESSRTNQTTLIMSGNCETAHNGAFPLNLDQTAMDDLTPFVGSASSKCWIYDVALSTPALKSDEVRAYRYSSFNQSNGQWNVSKSGPFTGVFIMHPIPENQCLDMQVTVNIGADASNMLVSNSDMYNQEQTTFNLYFYYDYRNNRFDIGSSTSDQVTWFFDMASCADGLLKWGDRRGPGNKGWTWTPGIGSDESNGLNSALRILSNHFTFNFVATASKETYYLGD